MGTAEDPAHLPRFGMLRTIAVYKLVKVLLLLLVAYGEIRLHDPSLTAKLLSWAADRPSGLEHDVVKQALVWFSGLSDSRIHALRVVTLSYAACLRGRGGGALDAAALGGVVDDDHYRLSHSPRSLGIDSQTHHRQGCGVVGQHCDRRVSVLARVDAPQDATAGRPTARARELSPAQP